MKTQIRELIGRYESKLAKVKFEMEVCSKLGHSAEHVKLKAVEDVLKMMIRDLNKLL